MDSIDAAFEDLTILRRCMKHIHWFSPGVPGDELFQEPKQCLEYGHSQLFANGLINPRTITTEVFHDACRLGRANVVENLIKIYNQNPSALQYKNWSSLHTAMAHNQKEVVEILLQLGVKSTRTEDGVYASGLRPELWALCGGEIEVYTYRGLNDVYDEYDSDDSEDQIRKVDDSYYHIESILTSITNLTDIQLSPEELWSRQTSVGNLLCLLVDNLGVQFLKREKPVYDINIMKKLIIVNNTYSLLRLCFDLGVDVTHNDNYLWYSISKGYYDKTRLLLHHGANPNFTYRRYNMKLLARACELDRLDIVQLLLEYNADVNGLSYDDKTALHIAVITGSVDIVRVLLENGADTSLRATWRGLTPVEMIEPDNPESARQIKDLFREFDEEEEEEEEEEEDFEPNSKRSRRHV